MEVIENCPALELAFSIQLTIFLVPTMDKFAGFKQGFVFSFFLYIFFNQFGAIGLRYDFDAKYRNVQVLFSPISVSYIG